MFEGVCIDFDLGRCGQKLPSMVCMDAPFLSIDYSVCEAASQLRQLRAALGCCGRNGICPHFPSSGKHPQTKSGEMATPLNSGGLNFSLFPFCKKKGNPILEKNYFGLGVLFLIALRDFGFCYVHVLLSCSCTSTSCSTSSHRQ